MDRDELIARYKAGQRNFRDADLRRANLRGVDLPGIDLAGALLWSADIRHADLQRADLRYADLRDILLVGADIRHAILRGADLAGADLTDANLTDADLTGAVVEWPAGWSPGTRIRCRECGCGKTEAGYTDTRVVLASQVNGMVYILHERNNVVLAVSLAEAAEMRIA